MQLSKILLIFGCTGSSLLQGLFASSILNEDCFFLGKNVVHQLTVTLEDLYNGATRKLALQKNVICDKCEGMSAFVVKNGTETFLDI